MPMFGVKINYNQESRLEYTVFRIKRQNKLEKIPAEIYEGNKFCLFC